MQRVAGPLGHRVIVSIDLMVMAAAVGVGVAGMIAARSDVDVQSAPLSLPMVLCSALVAVPLWWRRDRPFTVMGLVLVLWLAAGAAGDGGLHPAQLLGEAVVCCYALGAWSAHPRRAVALLVALTGLIVASSAGDGANPFAAVAYGAVLIALPAVAGYAARTRRRYIEQVETRLVEAERDRDERARRAVAEERNRIARELHDVVAHHVSLIGVQAGAARTAFDRTPDVTRAALEGIEASSRAAVGEMRQLLGVLSPIDAGGDAGDRGARSARPGSALPPPEMTAPQPDLYRVESLLDGWRAVGMTIDATFSGDPSTLSPTCSLAAYRIVEEALTNVSRHSRADSATVQVEVASDLVRVVVSDAGPARLDPIDRPPGRGLLGMRERVAVCGGSLEVGPLPAGGFRVAATLPVTTGNGSA